MVPFAVSFDPFTSFSFLFLHYLYHFEWLFNFRKLSLIGKILFKIKFIQVVSKFDSISYFFHKKKPKKLYLKSQFQIEVETLFFFRLFHSQIKKADVDAMRIKCFMITIALCNSSSKIAI